MSNWRDSILSEFVPNVSKLTLVSDPDSLLTEEKLAEGLRERGFDLIEFNDPIAFRYAYESKYRSIWDKGDVTDLVVVLRMKDTQKECLPYDLLTSGRYLYWSLGDLFPHFSYPVIDSLDRSLLDKLYEAQQKMQPERMGDNATKDFILRHVYGVAAELISNDVELLHCLLRLHYGALDMPLILAERLISVLEAGKAFEEWDLRRIVRDKDAFYTFIQERWLFFLNDFTKSNVVKEDEPDELRINGPKDLPFGHQDIKVYIDNLFVEGKLTPVKAVGLSVDRETWILSGVIHDGDDKTDERLLRLLDMVERVEIDVDSRADDWKLFASKWAEVSALIHQCKNKDIHERYLKLSSERNNLFADWLQGHYAGLVNLSPARPMMLHHLARYLARRMEEGKSQKIALIVIDGLALDQWVCVRDCLQLKQNGFELDESVSFAWIPTLTSVSRQSIFAGKAPFYFPKYIDSTHNEEKMWKQFWHDHNIEKNQIFYKRCLGDDKESDNLENLINTDRVSVIGLVIDKVDKIMHGMQMGAKGMHDQIRLWCETGYLADLLHYLSDHGYDVWLTSDHGNIEARGKGRPSEGSLADSRGERVRIYSNKELRSRVSSCFNFAREWEPAGLPDNYFPLVATNDDAFIFEGDTVVGHGGISMEEVIVPLINITKNHFNE